MRVPVVALGVVLTATVAFAASDPGARCCAAKLKASGAREKQIFRCWAQAAARGIATADTACVTSAGLVLARQFTRAEDGGCAGIGDATRVRADLERIAGDIGALLHPTSAVSACAARKLKLAGRLAQSLARAFSEQAPRPSDHLGELDPIVTALGQQFTARYAQLESGGSCPTTGDATGIWQRLAAGLNAPTVPDGVLRLSMRVCPACGDNVQGGTEQCDGFDAPDCNGGNCRPGCVCPTCGDGVKNQASETCDGTDATACPGLCQPNCTCPPPVCGNGIKEAGEACDGADLAGCPACQVDCTCTTPVCGNGVVESGEQCDGALCALGYITGCRPPGPGGCTCCGYPCYQFGCCDPEETCMPAPSTGYCFKFQCDLSPDCYPGYVCTDLRPMYPFSACLPGLGAGCFFPDFNGGFTLPCATPGAVCNQGFCCLPSGTACSGGGCCLGLTCTAGTCS